MSDNVGVFNIGSAVQKSITNSNAPLAATRRALSTLTHAVESVVVDITPDIFLNSVNETSGVLHTKNSFIVFEDGHTDTSFYVNAYFNNDQIFRKKQQPRQWTTGSVDIKLYNSFDIDIRCAVYPGYLQHGRCDVTVSSDTSTYSEFIPSGASGNQYDRLIIHVRNDASTLSTFLSFVRTDSTVLSRAVITAPVLSSSYYGWGLSPNFISSATSIVDNVDVVMSKYIVNTGSVSLSTSTGITNNDRGLKYSGITRGIAGDFAAGPYNSAVLIHLTGNIVDSVGSDNPVWLLNTTASFTGAVLRPTGSPFIPEAYYIISSGSVGNVDNNISVTDLARIFGGGDVISGSAYSTDYTNNSGIADSAQDQLDKLIQSASMPGTEYF